MYTNILFDDVQLNASVFISVLLSSMPIDKLLVISAAV